MRSSARCGPAAPRASDPRSRREPRGAADLLERGLAGDQAGIIRVVDGEACVRFCPKYPRHLVQFSSVKDILQNSQREFFALRLRDAAADSHGHELFELQRYGLDVAETDGTLSAVGSTYSPENDAVYDGTSQRVDGRRERLQRRDGEHVDPRNAEAAGAIIKPAGQRLDLGHLGHLPRLRAPHAARQLDSSTARQLDSSTDAGHPILAT